MSAESISEIGAKLEGLAIARPKSGKPQACPLRPRR